MRVRVHVHVHARVREALVCMRALIERAFMLCFYTHARTHLISSHT